MIPSSPTRGPFALLATCLLAGSIALGACGSSEDPNRNYVDSLNDITKSARQSINDLSAKLNEVDLGSLKGAGELLATFSGRVRDLASQIGKIDPPAEVRRLHFQLVSLMKQLANKTRSLALTLKAGDLFGGLPKIASVAGDTAQIGSRLDSTIGEIKSKLGIDQ